MLRIYSEDGTHNINFLATDAPWRLLYASPAMPASVDDGLGNLPMGGVIPHIIPLLAPDLLSPDYTTTADEINQALEHARLWKAQPWRYEPVWLHATAKGQRTRRFLITGGYLQELSTAGMDQYGSPAKLRVDLALWLHNAPPEQWGEQAIGQLPTYVHSPAGSLHTMSPPARMRVTATGAGVSCWGGTLALPAGGTRPGRIGKFALSGNSAETSEFETVWAGIKPLHYEAGGASDFNPVWKIDAGAYTYVGDPYGGSPGGVGDDSYVQQTLTDNSGAWGRCWTVSLANVYAGGNTSHFRGRYLALLRADLANNPDILLKLRLGYGLATAADGADLIYENNIRRVVAPGGGTHHVIEMGYVTIPPYSGRGLGALTEVVLQLDAYVADTGETIVVNWYELILIPAMHMVKAAGLALKYSGGDLRPFTVYVDPDDAISSLQWRSSSPYSQDHLRQVVGWTMPHEGGVLVAVAAQAGAYGYPQLYSDDIIDVGAVLHNRYISWHPT